MAFVIQPTHFFLTLSVAYLSNLDGNGEKEFCGPTQGLVCQADLLLPCFV